MIVNASRLAWFFSKMLEEFASLERRIVAILDERPWLHNRTLNGYAIMGSPANISNIIDEYATHGIEIGKVVIAAHPENKTGPIWDELSGICKARNIPVEWLHERLLFSRSDNSETSELPALDDELGVSFSGGVYWTIKRLLDIALSLGAMITIAPLATLVAALVFLDVGCPIVFWQQRVGHLGRPLHVYKFRTMRNSFDRDGQPIPEAERLSLLGRLLRRNRLDEIPQLFNTFYWEACLLSGRGLCFQSINQRIAASAFRYGRVSRAWRRSMAVPYCRLMRKTPWTSGTWNIPTCCSILRSSFVQFG